MARKSSNLRLAGVLLALVLVYAGVRFFGGYSRSQSFRETLEDIDTAKVTRIGISKGDTETELEKKDHGWQVIEGDIEAIADKQKVKGALATLLTIKPGRIVSRKPEKWKDFQVDSTGTQVRVFEGNSKTLDLVIGRFDMKGQREFLTYVRLSADDNVYTADNFMSFSLSQESKNFRNNNLVKVTKDSISLISFKYTDNSFQLIRNGDLWQIEEKIADSTASVYFIRDISYLTNTNFANHVDIEALSEPVSIVVNIDGETTPVEIKAYSDSSGNWIFNTSQNPTEYFSDSVLVRKVLKSRDYFLIQ